MPVNGAFAARSYMPYMLHVLFLIPDQFQAVGESIESRFEMAEAVGVLEECACCYDDKVIPESILRCPSGHAFCKECVQRAADCAIGQGNTVLACMNGNCTTPIATTTLEQALKPQILNHLLKKMQGASIEEEHQKPAADEVNRAHTEANMRAFIANRITHAMIRTCNNCGRNFVKEDGCNMMVCVCGKKMCYVCKKPIDGYSHFPIGGECSIYDNPSLHADELKTAAKEARQKYIRRHPEAASLNPTEKDDWMVPERQGDNDNAPAIRKKKKEKKRKTKRGKR